MGKLTAVAKRQAQGKKHPPPPEAVCCLLLFSGSAPYTAWSMPLTQDPLFSPIASLELHSSSARTVHNRLPRREIQPGTVFFILLPKSLVNCERPVLPCKTPKDC